MSFFDWVRYSAVFVNQNFETVGFKVIKRSYGFKGLSDGTFKYKGGFYNIRPSAFRVQTAIKTHFFFNDDIFIYQIGNPDPFMFKNGQFVPFMDPEVYKVRLTNKLIVDLNNIAMGGPDWGTILKWFGLFAVGALVVYYMFLRPEQASQAVDVVNNVSNASIPVFTRGGVA